jgi:uncharacterized protein (UPF0335 family)
MPDGSNPDGVNTAQRSVAAGQLLNIVERVERLNEELKEVNAQKAEVFAECKAYGFDTKTVKEVIKRRNIPTEQRQEQDALLDLYQSALGMLP